MEKVEAFLEEWIYPHIPRSRTTRAILIGSAVGLVVYYVTKKRYRLPPGPRAYPIVGNLLSFKKPTFFENLKDWQKIYGPVMTIAFGPMKCIVLNRYDIIHEALVKKAADFAGRPDMYSVKMMTEGNKDIAFTNYGPTWQLHRRIALKALKYYMKGEQFVDLIGEVLDDVIAEMLKREDGAFDINPYVGLTIFNIIAKICFDEMFEYGDQEMTRFMQCIEEINEAFSTGVLEDFIPIFRYFPTAKFKRALATNQELLDFVYKRIDQHRETFSEDTQRDFTDALLTAHKEWMEENPGSQAEISDTHLGQTVADVFEAGIDTSRQTLHWTILYVAAHPEVQAKLHQELDNVMGERTRPIASDREKLVYTEAVLYESMRVGSVAALTLPHTATCDTSIGGYDIPQGMMVIANIFDVHHDPNNFDNPESFIPERFIDSSGKFNKPEKWLPFSLGKRACMAESLAKPELQLVIAGLFRNLEVRMPEGVTADIQPKENFMLVLPKPYQVVIKSRTK